MKRGDWSFLLLLLMLDLFIVTCLDHPCCEVENEAHGAHGAQGLEGLVSMDCSQCGLKEIPENIPSTTSVLTLRSNSLAGVPQFSFAQLSNLTVLDLSDNPIQELENDSFSGLSLLQHLDLRRTEYHLQRPLPSGVFDPLQNLLTLKLDYIFPGEVNYLPTYQTSLFSSLGKLTFLQMAVPEAFTFGEEFRPLKNLETLVVYGWNCNLGAITQDTFAVFADTKLKVLEVRDCKVAHIEPTGFDHFLHLHTLNLACNKEGSLINFFEAVKKVPSENLTTLILDGSSKSDMFQSFDPNLLGGKVFHQLTHLSLRSTKILKIDPDVFLRLPKLEHITFGFNVLLFAADKEFFNKTAHAINAGRLRTVDISHFGEVFGGHNNFRHMYCRNADRYSADFFRAVPPYITLPEVAIENQNEINYTRFDDSEKFLLDNLPRSVNAIFARSLASRSTKLNGLQISPDNNIIYLDVSFLPVKWFAKPLIGLTRLQGLDLSSCRIETITPQAFSYLPSLVYLNLTRNNLKNTDLGELLRNVTSLKWLDISFNDLETIPNDTFTRMENLTSLILKGNHINQVQFNLTQNHHLQFIDLSLCAMPYIEKHFIQQLEAIREKSGKALRVDVSGILFECECPALDFIDWLNSTDIEIANKHNLECRYKNVNTTVLSVDTTELKRRCSGWPSNEALATIAVGVATVAIVAVYLAFEYRWTLRWYYYKSRRTIIQFWRRFFPNDNLQLNRTYKAFISYDDSNDPGSATEWVEDVLVSRLEDHPDWRMPVCLLRRNFDGGLSFLNITFQAVLSSQFTIIVLTPSYENSCFGEMRMAIENGIQNIIIINKEHVQEPSDDLAALLTVARCLEYVEEPQGLERFWAELHDILSAYE